MAKVECKLPAEVVDSFNGEPRLHVRATLDLGNTPVTEPIRTIHVVNDEYPFCAHSLEAKLSLEGFDSFETITFLRASNVNQPRALFSR